MTRRNIIAIAILLSSGYTLSAQTAGEVQFDYPRTLSEQVTTPSPDAATMLRYQDCPVSYATGTADISIPLMQWNAGGVDMSLSISYHTGGIKVKDEAGYIGLGWSLNGLGRVSRQICVMPDESRPFIQHYGKTGFTNDEYEDILFYKKEANFDRYNYDFPGYSGSFIIDGDSIVDFSQNGVTIRKENLYGHPGVIMSFSITTPEGVKFTFGHKESIDHDNKVREGAYEYYDLSYTANVVWNLTEIRPLNSNDAVRITYGGKDGFVHDEDVKIPTITRIWSYCKEAERYVKNRNAGKQSKTVFYNRGIPSSIKSKNATVKFSCAIVPESKKDDKRIVTSIALYNSQDKEIRKVSFENMSLFENYKPRLDGVLIYDDGQLVDSRKFEYFQGCKNSLGDFFGYANGETGNGSHNIVDPDNLELNKDRATAQSFIQSWSLRKIIDATGVETTFEYAPSKWYPTENSMIKSAITCGQVVRSIKAYDPITRRERKRTFHYYEPKMSVELNYLTLDDFISLSGVKTYGEYSPVYALGMDDTYSTYALSATFTAFCRRPGYRAENMTIYYDKIVETISGDHVDQIRNEFYYDNSHCIHSNTSHVSWPLPASPLQIPPGETMSTAHFSLRLGEYIPYRSGLMFEKYNEQDFKRVFGHKLTTSYTTERTNPQPLLVKRISYEYRNGSHVPFETETRHYSSQNRFAYPIGLYIQSNVYKTFFQGDYIFNINEPDAFEHEKSISTDRMQTWVVSERMRLDSTSTTRHYPDGNSRTISTKRYYNRLLSEPDNRVYEDPDTVFASPSDSIVLNNSAILPVTTVISHGNDYLTYNIVRSGNINTRAFKPIIDRKLYRLPVKEQWHAKVNGLVDSLTLDYKYARILGNLFRQVSKTLYSEPSMVSARQSFTSYDTFGNLTSMIESNGNILNFEWDTDNCLLLSKSLLLDGNQTLKSQYTYEPLIGCTSIKHPSGMKHTFEYSGGILTAEKNTAGATVFSYGRSVYGCDRKNMTFVSSHNDTGKSTVRTFYDGFGLPVQTTSVNAGDDCLNDVTSFTGYDALDRPHIYWLPVPTEGLDSLLTPFQKQDIVNGYYGQGTRPHKIIEYTATNRSDISAVYTHCAVDSDYYSSTSYLCNNTNDLKLTVRHYKVSKNLLAVCFSSYYQAGELDAVKEISVDGDELITFYNWAGYKILERKVMSDNEFLDTYFINDPWGKPLIILPPEASNALSQKGKIYKTSANKDILEYAFIYHYDRCGRIVQKKIPGCEPIKYSYDAYGRLAFFQDGNMRDEGKASFTLYDAASRPVVSGLCSEYNDGDTPPPMKASFDATKSGIGGSGYVADDAVDLTDAELLTATYFDRYDFLSLDAFSSMPFNFLEPATGMGMPTGSLNAVLDPDGKSQKNIASFTYYDEEGHPVETYSTSRLADTYESTVTSFTLDGQPKTQTHTLVFDGCSLTDSYEYTYDLIGRVSKITASFPNFDGKVVLAENGYGSIGNLERLTTHGITTLYGYDIGGNVSQINADGNLYQSIVRSPGGRVSTLYDDTIEHTYEYDRAGRLTGETCDNGGSMGGMFSSYYTYDRNGNIETISRQGYPTGHPWRTGIVDDLVLEYEGNRLIKVNDMADEVLIEKSFDFHDGADNSVEYRYDSNGNVIRDDNRNIVNIDYNLLDLPERIDISPDRSVEYVYDSSGKKLASVLREAENYSVEAAQSQLVLPVANSLLPEHDRIISTHDYIGAYEFVDGDLLRINTPFGYYNGNDFVPYIRDYLGSNRNHALYYAYGLPTDGTTAGMDDPFLYLGKEFCVERGINLFDFEARTYAPDISRFLQPDPMAEKYYDISPYAYCAGDPVNYVDMDGCDYWYTNDISEIINFYNTITSGEQAFDFSNWIHLSDTDFFNNLVYDDNKYILYATYCTVENGNFIVNCNTYNLNIYPVKNYKDIQIYEPVDGILDRIIYTLKPWTYNDGVTTWSVGPNGKITGIAPRFDFPPLVGKGKILKAGKWLIGGREKMGKAIGNMSGNRVVQRKQIDHYVAKYHLTQKQRKILHDEVSHQGLGFHEIDDLVKELFMK